jgi:hypothetical protein
MIAREKEKRGIENGTALGVILLLPSYSLRLSLFIDATGLVLLNSNILHLLPSDTATDNVVNVAGEGEI